MEHPLIRLPFNHLTAGGVLLMLGGLLSCLLLSLLLHYDQSTVTLCTYTQCTGTQCTVLSVKVSNYLPSVSASVSLVPERYVWRTCVALHSAPRYLTSAAYFAFYLRRFPSATGRMLAGLNLVCSLTENTALLLLTYVSSSETYSVHENNVILFMVCSVLHMSSTCTLWYSISKHSRRDREVTLYRWKLTAFLFHVACGVATVYFFLRHNRFCEAGIYSLFSLFQFLLVGSNMAFHLTAFWDFKNHDMLVATPPEDMLVATPPEDMLVTTPPEDMLVTTPPEDILVTTPPEGLTLP